MENLEPTQQIQPQEPENIPSPRKSLKFLIPLLIIVGILVAGYFVLAKTQNFWPFKSKEIESPSTSLGTTGDTASWQTYRNQEFGFEVRYPNDWIAVDQQKFVDFGPTGTTAGNGKVKLDLACFSTIEYHAYDEIATSTQEVILGGNEYKKISYFGVKNGSKSLLFHHFLSDYPNWFKEQHEITLNRCPGLLFGISPEVEENIGNQILSTFKFIDPEIDTSNWKIYKNTKFNYSINYPPEFTIFTGTNQQKQEVIPPTPTSQKVSLTNNKEFLFCCEALITSVQVINDPIDTNNWKQYANIPDYRIKSQGEITFAGKKAFEVRASVGIDSAGARLILISGNPFSYVIIQGDEGEPWGKITNSFRLE